MKYDCFYRYERVNLSSKIILILFRNYCLSKQVNVRKIITCFLIILLLEKIDLLFDILIHIYNLHTGVRIMTQYALNNIIKLRIY